MKYHTLILEGGGVKGYAYPFALQELERLQIIKLANIHTFAGSSAGAITAALLACGMTPENLIEALSIDFSVFQDDKAGVLRDAWNIHKHFGYCEGKVFEDWFKTYLKRLTGNFEITFAECHNDLHITATNLSCGYLNIFNRKNTPHLTIWKAVRMSMSIPLFFKPYKFRGDYYVDGGLLRNFLDLPGDGGELGLRLTGNDDYGSNHKEINSLPDFIGCLVNTMMHSAEQQHVSKSLWKNTIDILTGNISAIDFNLSDKQKEFLAQSAKTAVNKWVEG